MAIPIIDSLEVVTNKPIETKMQVATLAERDAIPLNERWEGMSTYVLEDSTTYTLVSGITNGNWATQGGGNASLWSTFPAIQDVDINDEDINNINNATIKGSLYIGRYGEGDPANITFDRADTKIYVGMGFHIRSGEGVVLEAPDLTDPEAPLERGLIFGTDAIMGVYNDSGLLGTIDLGGDGGSVLLKSGGTMDLNAAIAFNNGSSIHQGTTDAGYGGNGGIELECSVGYKLKWDAGRLFTMQQDGFTIREVAHQAIAPTSTDDDTKGYVVGSRWITDAGETYNCIDATTSAAVWELFILSLSGWDLNGNNGTDPDINSAGTNDNVGFSIKTNDIERIYISEGGKVGIGNRNNTFNLDVGEVVSEDTIEVVTDIAAPYFEAYIAPLDDATIDFSTHTFTPDSYINYDFNISSLSPDTINWTDYTNSGSFIITPNVPQLLSNGVKVTFANDTGHGGDEYWSFGISIYNNTITTTTRVNGVINATNEYRINGDFFATQKNNSLFINNENGALSNNTTYSNFIGINAGNLATAASSSNFIGTDSGNGATNANNSNFIGKNTGVSATNAYNSVFIGSDAGNGATNADHSHFIGGGAGYLATGANDSQFIGHQTGAYSTNAHQSQFIGNGAGGAATEANSSVFIGTDSGNGATNASNSVFIGAVSGTYATNASYSNFIGAYAAYGLDGFGNQSTNAHHSNFFGYWSGGSAIEANNSNFFGSQTGNRATNASFSNFIGSSAGEYATNANNSNFIGAGVTGIYGTGYLAVNASYSNFIGYSAGQGATNASYSNLIGYKAGIYNYTNAHTIGSNNIIIGTNISLPNTRANGINIGSIIFGINTYATTTGDPSIAGTATGRIGIGTVTPTAVLDLRASTTADAALRLRVGSAPTSPNDGDIWLESNTNTGLKIRINGVTKTITLI